MLRDSRPFQSTLRLEAGVRITDVMRVACFDCIAGRNPTARFEAPTGCRETSPRLGRQQQGLMDPPFEVDGTYCNRDGDYEVVEISGPKMIISYKDGRQLQTTVTLQACIWKHRRAEDRMRSRARQRASVPVRQSKGSGTIQLRLCVKTFSFSPLHSPLTLFVTPSSPCLPFPLSAAPPFPFPYSLLPPLYPKSTLYFPIDIPKLPS